MTTTRTATIRLYVAAVLLAGAAAMPLRTAAQDRVLHKSILPDGSVVYADAPVPGATKVQKIAIPPAPAGAQQAGEDLSAVQQKLLQDSDARQREWAAVERELAAAYEELTAARAAREAGRAVTEGDRIGRRFSELYWLRQRRLDAAVQNAAARLDAALARRNALR